MAQGLSAAAAESARAIKRIDDVVTLRAAQFPEDNGPWLTPFVRKAIKKLGTFTQLLSTKKVQKLSYDAYPSGRTNISCRNGRVL